MSKNSPKTAIYANITPDQINILSIQFNSVARYFKTSLSDDIIFGIEKRVCKLNQVKSMNQLNETQYNNSMHYLRNMEYVMYQYYWCISFIEKELFKSLLDRNIDNKTAIYDRDKYAVGINRLNRVQNVSKELINLKILKELY